MSFLDKAKAAAEQAKAKAIEAAEVAKTKAQEAAAKVESAGYVEKAASFVDDKTKGKYSDKIAKAQDSAKNAVGKVSSN